MKRWWLVAVLLLSIGLNVGLLIGRRLAPQEAPSSRPSVQATGEASQAARRIPPRLRKMLDRMADDLSLEGEKRLEFMANQEEFFRTTIEKRNEVRRAQRALRKEMMSENPRREKADEFLATSLRAQSEVEQAFVAHYFATQALLETPEQKRLLKRFMARLRQLRKQVERRFEERRLEDRRGAWQRGEDRRRPRARDGGAGESPRDQSPEERPVPPE